MNSDNFNRPERPLTSRDDRLFPLPKQGQKFETKRMLIGLYKQRPLETDREFAERIVRDFRVYQAKQQARRSKLEQPKP
jgi:hypothetical protein